MSSWPHDGAVLHSHAAQILYGGPIRQTPQQSSYSPSSCVSGPLNGASLHSDAQCHGHEQRTRHDIHPSWRSRYGGRNRPKCYFCGKVGHFEYKCFAKFPQLRPQLNTYEKHVSRSLSGARVEPSTHRHQPEGCVADRHRAYASHEGNQQADEPTPVVCVDLSVLPRDIMPITLRRVTDIKPSSAKSFSPEDQRASGNADHGDEFQGYLGQTEVREATQCGISCPKNPSTQSLADAPDEMPIVDQDMTNRVSQQSVARSLVDEHVVELSFETSVPDIVRLDAAQSITTVEKPMPNTESPYLALTKEQTSEPLEVRRSSELTKLVMADPDNVRACVGSEHPFTEPIEAAPVEQSTVAIGPVKYDSAASTVATTEPFRGHLFTQEEPIVHVALTEAHVATQSITGFGSEANQSSDVVHGTRSDITPPVQGNTSDTVQYGASQNVDFPVKASSKDHRTQKNNKKRRTKKYVALFNRNRIIIDMLQGAHWQCASSTPQCHWYPVNNSHEACACCSCTASSTYHQRLG